MTYSCLAWKTGTNREWSCRRVSSETPGPSPHPNWDAYKMCQNSPFERICIWITPPRGFASWNKDRIGLQDKVYSTLRATGSQKLPTHRAGLWDPALTQEIT